MTHMVLHTSSIFSDLLALCRQVAGLYRRAARHSDSAERRLLCYQQAHLCEQVVADLPSAISVSVNSDLPTGCLIDAGDDTRIELIQATERRLLNQLRARVEHIEHDESRRELASRLARLQMAHDYLQVRLARPDVAHLH